MEETKVAMQKIEEDEERAIIEFLWCLVTLYCEKDFIEELGLDEFEECITSVISIYGKLNDDKHICGLTDKEIVDLYWDIECYFFDVIRKDEYIDNILWAKSIINVHGILSDYIKANHLTKIWS